LLQRIKSPRRLESDSGTFAIRPTTGTLKFAGWPYVARSTTTGTWRGYVDAFAAYPREEYAEELGIFGCEERKEMANDRHVPAAKLAGRPMADHVAVCCVVEDGIRAAVGLKGAVGTARERLHDGGFDHFRQPLPAEDGPIVVMNIP
jgi:hypothetical protein